MNVSYVATTSGKLSELAIVNGQIIYLSDLNATYYDMGNTRRLISSVRIVDSLPSTAVVQENVIYCVPNSSGSVSASIWDPTSELFKSLVGQVATVGTLGLVQPDGTSITIDENGVITAHGTVDALPASSVIYDNSESGLASTEVQSALGEIVNIAKTQSDWAQSSTAAVDYIKNKPELARVATSGDYTDLSNTPTLGTAAAANSTTAVTENSTDLLTSGAAFTALADKVNSSSLADVATSGDYVDLTNKPTLGTASAKDVPVTGNASTAQVVTGNDTRLTDSRNAADVYPWAKAQSKPTYTAAEVGALASTAAGVANGIATLDSNGKLTSTQLPLGNASTNAYYGDKGKTAYDHSQVTSGNPHNVTASDVGLGNVGNFKAVSTAANQGLSSTEKANAIANIGASTFSGSYNDLSDKPTIPTVNDGTLTIKRNGTAVASFTANSSTTVEADISVPTKTSDLTNDSNFISGSNLAAIGFGYGTCDTAGSTAAKTATLANFALTTGALVSIKFTNAVPANATLSINSTTAKNIYYKGAAITAGIINAGDTALFVYSGQYQLLAVDSLIGTALITE